MTSEDSSTAIYSEEKYYAGRVYRFLVIVMTSICTFMGFMALLSTPYYKGSWDHIWGNLFVSMSVFSFFVLFLTFFRPVLVLENEGFNESKLGDETQGKPVGTTRALRIPGIFFKGQVIPLSDIVSLNQVNWPLLPLLVLTHKASGEEEKIRFVGLTTKQVKRLASLKSV